MIKKSLLSCLLLLLLSPVNAAPIDVILISPTSPNDVFWSQVSKITQASANDLSVNLTIHHNASNRFVLNELIKKIIQLDNKPDYLIFMPFGGGLEHTFNLLEQAKIPFVTLERTYEQILHVKNIGAPLEKFSYWIGEVFFDNFSAGELLAQTLFTHAIKQDINKSIKYTALGLSGDFHPASSRRNKGLIISAEQNSVEIKQIIYTNWQQNIAKSKLVKLFKRHGQVDIIWCASDVNAFGALEGLKQLNIRPNHDVVIGGFDWTPQALQKIQKNELTASIGGHIFQGARALIKIFDYHHGSDNFNRTSKYQGYLLEIIDLNNIDQYKVLTKEVDWEAVNFGLFSSTKQQQTLPFTTLNILTTLSKKPPLLGVQ